MITLIKDQMDSIMGDQGGWLLLLRAGNWEESMPYWWRNWASLKRLRCGEQCKLCQAVLIPSISPSKLAEAD